jgi:metallo-beta-lactamase family protein
LFGGDLGRYDRSILPDPAAAVAAEVVLLESTYGDRDHPTDDDYQRFAEIIVETARRGGKLIIPAFAIGRVEELVYALRQLELERRIPVLPVYVDSPMAVEALRYYAARADELDPDVRPTHKAVSTFCTTRFHTVASPQQSKELTASRQSAIVISASGMATGGRVLHHLVAALPNANSTVLFVGYQAPGTRGRSLVDGAPEVKIHGRWVPVRARVEKIDSMSAHADRGEILRWLGTLPAPPRVLCLVHGDTVPMAALKQLIQERLGWDAQTPEHRQTIEL